MRLFLTTIILTMLAQPVWGEPIKLLCYQLPKEKFELTNDTGLLSLLDQMTQRLEELNSELDAATAEVNRSKSYDGPPDREYSVYELDMVKPSFKWARVSKPWWEEFIGEAFSSKIEEVDDANLWLTFESPKRMKVWFRIDRVSGLVEQAVYEWRTEKENELQENEGWKLDHLFGIQKMSCQRYSNELRQF